MVNTSYTPKQLQKRRIQNMQRDKRYFVVLEFKEEAEKTSFHLINIKTKNNIKICITNQRYISCDCMDWIGTCKKQGIMCKHILFILLKVLKIDISIVKYNQINDYDELKSSFGRIAKLDTNILQRYAVGFDRLITSEDSCPICFSDFMKDEKASILCCFQCKNLFHRECILYWLVSGSNKSCAICRNPEIVKVFKYAK